MPKLEDRGFFMYSDHPILQDQWQAMYMADHPGLVAAT